jgi:hypothetical protein
MNGKGMKSVALALAMSVGAMGCSNLTPEENAAVWGGIAGVAAGVTAAATGVDAQWVAPIAMGAALGAGTIAYFYAKHQANERQRKIAEARAQIYLAKLQEKQRSQAAAETSSSSSSGGGSGSSSKKAPAKAPVQTPRYLAVETEQAEGYKGSTAVMLYDTQSKSLVGNDVYDLKSEPKSGSVAKYDTVQAQYVPGA